MCVCVCVLSTSALVAFSSYVNYLDRDQKSTTNFENVSDVQGILEWMYRRQTS